MTTPPDESLPPDAPLEPATPPTAPLRPAGPCASCGDSTTAPSGLCAVCEGTLKGYAGVTPVSADDGPVIVTDRICFHCGYRLDGLRSDRECPECGVPIANSLRGDLLRFSAPDHLRTLHIGVTIAEICVLSIIPLGLLTMGLEIMGVEFGLTSRARAFLDEGLGVMFTALSIVGWWMFSTPDPVQLGRDTAIGARRLLRLSLIVELIVSLGQFGAKFLFPSHMRMSFDIGPAFDPLTAGLAALGTLMWLLRFFTSLMYMQTVALRIPNASLYKHAGRFMWLGPVVTFLTCGFGIVLAYVSYIVMLESARRLLKAERARAASLRPHA